MLKSILKKIHPIRMGDIILIIMVALLSVGALFAVPLVLGEAGGGGKTIVVTMDGEELYRFPLTDSNELELIEFPLEVDGTTYQAVLEVQDGAVRLQRLPNDISPLSIHADIGWIREPYQMIVSLPVKLYISIIYEEEQEGAPEIDAMVY